MNSKNKKTSINPVQLIIACAGFILFAVTNLFAVMHKDGLYPGHFEPDFKKSSALHKAIVKDAVKYPNGITRPYIGNRNVAVVIVQFPGAGPSISGSYQLTSADILRFQDTMDYLKNFYIEASFNKLNINITYFYSGGNSSTLAGSEIPFTLPTSMGSYGIGDENGSDSGIVSLIKDSISQVSSATLNSSSFDIVIAAHAGYGNESTSNDGDIWSAYVTLDTAKNGFIEGINIPARENGASPRGVSCHEFGHAVGLPDVYTTGSSAATVVGRWCLMDYGPWANNGFSPTHPSVWCKKYLGWVEPVIVNGSANITNIRPIEVSSACVYQIDLLGNPEEYFLVCYSSRTYYNSYAPGDGILIWHVDEGYISGTTIDYRLANNVINNLAHPTLDIVCADYTRPSSYPFGNASNAWPGVKGSFVTPYSDSYTGLPSSINISDILYSGLDASFKIGQVAMSSLSLISKAINYPNPCGNKYPHPSSNTGVITTFAFEMTGVSNDKDFSIFTVNGERVCSVKGDNISFKLGKSSDYNVVYEYDWDGKNDNNENVAPGLYLYRFRSGSASKTGKFAVIR